MRIKYETTDTYFRERERNASADSYGSFFLSLTLLIQGVSMVFLSAVVSLLAFPIIFIFCLIGYVILKKLDLEKPLIKYFFAGFLGVLLGSTGYLMANFQGTVFAFALSGLAACVVIQLRVDNIFS